MKKSRRKLGAYAQAIKDGKIIIRCDVCSSRDLTNTETSPTRACNNCGRVLGEKDNFNNNTPF